MRAAMIVLGGALAAAAGCSTMHFEVANGPRGEQVVERNGHWAFDAGEVAGATTSVRERCPQGVRSITETTTAADAAGSFLTLGIWWPRTTIYECLASNDAQETP